MRGHITKRSKNSYSIKVSLGKDAMGNYKYQWITVKGNKTTAQKRLSEILNQLDNGTFMKPSKTTLREYFEKWLADYATPKLSPRSLERYSGIVRNSIIPELGHIILTQLKPEHIQSHYSAMLESGLSARTVHYHHAVIHKALQTAVKWGLASRNVADAVDPPRIKRPEMQYWNEDETASFLKTAENSPYYELFYMALFTGMRRGELLALRWQDVDLILSQVYVNRSLHQLKNGSYVFTEPKSERSRRTIALPLSAKLELIELYEKSKSNGEKLGTHLQDSDLVFSHIDGRPLRPNTITNAWRFLCKKANVKPIRLHDARHTHASLMLKQGIHPKVVQERLGHSSISITLDTYSHVSPGIQEAAAESFDKLLFPKREKEAV
ncbi:MAG: site-specific integrase [Bacteroidales bacterium]|jgi:integrase|nr:site-specific integrase [Bacteroidales bacterium]